MISVVIPLYNKQQSITATLDSVLAQTYTDYECIIVNDGSTDQSAQVVHDVICNMEDGIQGRFHLINKENGGVCSARNRGIREAKGEYIALLDGDDLWDRDYLLEQMRMINDFPDAAMWGINYCEVTQGDRPVRYQTTGLPDGYRGYVDNYFELAYRGRQSDLFCSSSVVIRRSAFDEVGCFDERIRYAEDTDMWWRIIANNRVAFYDRFMCFYQVDAENRALKRRRALHYYLPYYIAKYSGYKSINMVFYKFAHRWAAIKLRWEYFGNDVENREDAKMAIRELDYTMIPLKYRFFYKLPYVVGKCLSSLDYLRRKGR